MGLGLDILGGRGLRQNDHVRDDRVDRSYAREDARVLAVELHESVDDVREYVDVLGGLRQDGRTLVVGIQRAREMSLTARRVSRCSAP